MQRWEHSELIFRGGGQDSWQGPGGSKEQPPGVNAVEALNKLGAEGWQVASVTEGPNVVRYVLSRPVE